MQTFSECCVQAACMGTVLNVLQMRDCFCVISNLLPVYVCSIKEVMWMELDVLNYNSKSKVCWENGTKNLVMKLRSYKRV